MKWSVGADGKDTKTGAADVARFCVCVKHALDPFFAALNDLDNNAKRVVRIAHIGDSVVAAGYASVPAPTVFTATLYRPVYLWRGTANVLAPKRWLADTPRST